MVKTFTTKIDDRILRMLDAFCREYHFKKSIVVEEMIQEGIRRKEETMKLAESLQRGLEEEREGNLYTSAEVRDLVFGKKKTK